jgi:hypothetical protein
VRPQHSGHPTHPASPTLHALLPGGVDVELSVEGSVLLCRQRDQPGIVGTIGMLLAKDNVNINFMTVGGGGWGGGLQGTRIAAAAAAARAGSGRPPAARLHGRARDAGQPAPDARPPPAAAARPPPFPRRQVCRTGRNEEAVMAIGVDNDPSEAILKEMAGVKGVLEYTMFKEMSLV